MKRETPLIGSDALSIMRNPLDDAPAFIDPVMKSLVIPARIARSPVVMPESN